MDEVEENTEILELKATIERLLSGVERQSETITKILDQNERLVIVVGEQKERVDILEERLNDHVTVPSWWNKKVDRRLKGIEQAIAVLDHRTKPEDA